MDRIGQRVREGVLRLLGMLSAGVLFLRRSPLGFLYWLLPAGSIERIEPGWVYFGRHPRPGLWIVYRDARETRQRLVLGFGRPQEQQAVYERLIGRPEPAGEAKPPQEASA